MTKADKSIIVGISGASGVVYGIRALEILRDQGIETHLIMSKAAELTLAYETDRKPKDVRLLATHVYPIGDIGAAISSGSVLTAGMLILPCSVRSMSEIATGVTSTLLTRAADVTLKERRRLVLGFRETPLHAGHLRSMLQVTEMGGIVAPIVPAFYTRPTSIDQIVDHTIGRLLDLFGIHTDAVQRWKQDESYGEEQQATGILPAPNGTRGMRPPSG